jgi:hypothetical protein
VEATKKQDMEEHWDLKFIKPDKKEAKFDVKGLKKNNRSDNYFDDSIHWIELMNVNGNVGWLYGMADYFAFETSFDWVVVKKSTLQSFIDEKCDKSEILDKPELYKLYRRYGRKDLITKIKTDDLRQIKYMVINK